MITTIKLKDPNRFKVESPLKHIDIDNEEQEINLESAQYFAKFSDIDHSKPEEN